MGTRSVQQSLISDIYRAAVGALPYVQPARKLMKAMEANILTVVGVHVHSGRNQLLFAEGLAEQAFHAYRDYYGEKNFIIKRGVDVLTTRGYGQSTEFVEDREALRSEFYNEWQRPVGIFHTCGALVQSRGDWLYTLILGRPRRLGAWDKSEMNTLGAVHHHLRSALEIRSRFHTLQSMHRAMDTVVESLDEAVFILGRDDRVLHTNAAGQALLERNGPVSSPAGRLRGTGRSGSRALVLALEAARGPRMSASTMLFGDGLRYATTVVSARNTPSLLDLGSEADVIVFVHDPAHPAPTVRHLQLVFELTQREAEVVILLSTGHPPKSVAASLRLGLETVRTHIKRAMLKTGARTQTDLVGRVLRSIQPVRGMSASDRGAAPER